VKRLETSFIIDLETWRPVCRRCRRPCRSIQLEQFRAYACFNKECDNKWELRHYYADDTWVSVPLGKVWESEEVQDCVRQILSYVQEQISVKRDPAGVDAE